MKLFKPHKLGKEILDWKDFPSWLEESKGEGHLIHVWENLCLVKVSCLISSWWDFSVILVLYDMGQILKVFWVNYKVGPFFLLKKVKRLATCIVRYCLVVHLWLSVLIADIAGKRRCLSFPSLWFEVVKKGVFCDVLQRGFM